MRTTNLLPLLLILFISNAYAQQEINLSEKFSRNKLRAVNRVITDYGDQKNALEMNAENSDGLGILEEIEFETGTVEVELLGENNPGKSFLGFAFNIQDDSTYEVIYFRPFNFVAEEQLRKDHMVQYIYHPEFTWRKLRTEKTGEYEEEILNPPNPDNWFKATIKIDKAKISVYVNDQTKPSLTVKRLSAIKSKKIGIWTGYGSSGRFRNLSIKPN